MLKKSKSLLAVIFFAAFSSTSAHALYAQNVAMQFYLGTVENPIPLEGATVTVSLANCTNCDSYSGVTTETDASGQITINSTPGVYDIYISAGVDFAFHTQVDVWAASDRVYTFLIETPSYSGSGGGSTGGGTGTPTDACDATTLSMEDMLYQGILWRGLNRPDSDSWCAPMRESGGLASVASTIANSDEFNGVIAASYDRYTIINRMYQVFFGRDIDPDGVSTWVDSSLTYPEVVSALVTSGEFQTLHPYSPTPYVPSTGGGGGGSTGGGGGGGSTGGGTTSQVGDTFNYPRINGYQLDWCLTWGTNCGAPAADAYCRQNGYDFSTGYQQTPAGETTQIIGDGQLCGPPGCDTFSYITCGRNLPSCTVVSSNTDVLKGKPVTSYGPTTAGYVQAASNLTDGNQSTQAYPGSHSFDYEVDLQGCYVIDRIHANVGSYGGSSSFINTWQITGMDYNGNTVNLGSGGSPGSTAIDVANLPSGLVLRKIRFSATAGYYWIGAYELEANGPATAAPAAAAPGPGTAINVALNKPVQTLGPVNSQPQYVYPAANLTDGNNSSLAYPGLYAADYEVDLQDNYWIQSAEVYVGGFGWTSPYVYITSWEILGVAPDGAMYSLGKGASPQSDYIRIPVINGMYKRLRIRASSTANWFGFYEFKAMGYKPDYTDPAVTITSPAANANVQGNLTVTVSASDNVGVTSVELNVDGARQQTLTTAPYTFSFDTRNFVNGAHTLSVIAKDLAGNSSSDQVVVSINNPDVTPPTILITAPTANASAQGVMTLSALVTDNIGVASVEFKVDSAIVKSFSVAPYSFTVDTTAYANGAHVLTVTAKDPSGNSSVSQQSFTINNPDITPPAVSFASPANGAIVQGVISITANASDNIGVASVALSVDGVVKSTLSSGPFGFSLDTRVYANGAHTLLLTAMDAGGNTATAQISVTVNNPDITPPAVSFASPANGAIVQGVISITANASDNVGVASVTLSVDGVVKSALLSGPFGFSLDTRSYANGAHTLLLTAKDAAGNTATAQISVTVNNPDITPPTVSITSPAAGATVPNGTVTVSVSASDNIGVKKVELYVDGALTSSSTASPWSTTWNAKNASKGNHTLQVKAYDAAGNVGSSAVITVKK